MILKSGTLVNGRYRIESKIGTGGTAVVYKAVDEKLNRVVTLKALREEYADNEEFIKRFTTEAQAAARLNHPNIVSAYDVGRDGNLCYIIMEYIDGYTLKELIRKNAPFTNAETLGVALQIAAALAAAHENNIIHRDIKPQNILVTKEGNIKVTDFGIAKASSSSTITADQMGSAHYFSPEQARGGFVDNKSDIYSLGIVMYEMLTGRVPFDGDSPVTLAIKHMDEPMPDISVYNKDVSTSLVKIINKATAKKSIDRYQSAEELMDDLRRAINNSTGDFVTDNSEDSRNYNTIILTAEDRKAMRDRREGDRTGERAERHTERDRYSSERNNRNNRNNRRQPRPRTKEERDRDRRRRESAESRRVIIGGVLTGVVIVAVLTAVVSFLIGGNKSTDVKMPDFIGLSEELAQKSAKENGIFLDIAYVESEELQGIVVGQNPEEGTKLTRGDTVTVEISSGNGEVEVPDVVGNTVDEAQQTLRDAGIEHVDYEFQQSTNIPSGTVIRMEPEAGTMLKAGETLNLIVSISDKEKTVEVEDVLGKSESEARKILEEQGFEVKTSDVASDEYPKGQVCAQSRDGGFEAIEGSVITIYISTGPGEPQTEAPKQEQQQTQKPAETPTEATAEAPKTEVDTHQVQNVDYNQVVPNTATVNVPVTEVPDKDKVNVRITEVGLDGTETEVYSKDIDKSSFPYSYNTEGSGGTYNVYYDGQISAVHHYDDGNLTSSSIYEDGKLKDTVNY